MKLFYGGIVFIAIASFAPLAFGQEAIWENNGGTDFNTASNWTTGVPNITTSTFILPGFIPDPSNTSDVIVGGSTTINITNTTTDQAVSGLYSYGNFNLQGTQHSGTVSLDFSGTGDTLTIADGVVVNGGNTLDLIGNYVASDAVISIGNGTTLNEGVLDPTATASGTLNISSGTLDSGDMYLGEGSGNVGNVTQGSDTNNTSSTVTVGTYALIGYGGTGNYTLTNSSILQTISGVFGTIGVGVSNDGGGSGMGTLTVSDSSQVNILNDGSLNLGTDDGTLATGGTGILTQNGAGSSVNLSGTAVANIGDTGIGTYNLMAGTLNVGVNAGDTATLDIGTTSRGTGTFAQSGGTLTADEGSTVIIGDGGNGTYILSGGMADFQNGFTVGNQSGSNGNITQSGASVLTVENSAATIGALGPGGTGTYNLQGGTATFNAGVVVGAAGSVNQTGGTFTVPLGQTLDLSTVGSSYNLNGGTLQVGYDGVTNGLVGTTGQGTLNFGGGTLQAIAGSTSPVTDALDGTVTGNSTLDTTNADITLSGSLTGSGNFTVIGGGTVNLDDSNHAAGWGLTISNGTVNADAADFPETGNISIASNGAGATGTLNLNVANGVNTLTGNLTSTGTQGTGQFNVNFQATTDSLELGGKNNYSGVINLNGGGTLRVFNGTYGDIEDGGSGSSVEIGGDTSVAQSGTVTLAGPNNYTGLTMVNSQFTLITQNLSGDLTNNGTIGTGLTPYTLPSAANTPTMTIAGNLISTGTLEINANGASADLYQVNGTGASSVSGTITVDGVGQSAGVVILTDSNGTLTYDPNTLVQPVHGGSLLYYPQVMQSGNTLVFSATELPTAPYAQTPNERAVAAAIDPVLTSFTTPAGFTPLGRYYNSLTTANQISDALAMNSPESLQYSRMIAFENSTFLVQRVNGFLSDLRSGYTGWDTSGVSMVDPVMNSGLGRSMGSLLALNSPYHQPAPNGVNYYPEDDTAAPETESPISSGSVSDSANPLMVPASHPASNTYVPPSSVYKGPTMTEFISGDIILADLNQNQSNTNAPSSKASYTAGDATAGIAFRMNSNLSAGVLFDYNHTDADTDSHGSKTTVNSYSPGIFATYYDHGFYVNGLASFGWNTYSNDRNQSSLGTAHSSPNGQQYVGNLDFGYDFQPDRHWTLGPTLGLTYTHLDIDSFTETGAPGANLAVDSQSADSLRTRLGGHVVYSTHTGSILFQPNFSLMWQHEYLDNSSGITSTFNDWSSAPFTIQTAAPSRDSALISCGVTATLDNSMSLYLNYIADVGANDYFAQSVMGGLKARF